MYYKVNNLSKLNKIKKFILRYGQMDKNNDIIIEDKYIYLYKYVFKFFEKKRYLFSKVF